MAHLRTSLAQCAALAAALACSIAVSSSVQAQGFRQSITTISPPPAPRPEDGQSRRDPRSNTQNVAPAPTRGNNGNSTQLLRGTARDNATIGRQGSDRAANRDRNVSGDDNTNIPRSPPQTIVSQEQWRNSQTLTRQPANSSLVRDDRQTADDVAASERSDNDPGLTTIDVAPRLSRRRQLQQRFEPYQATGLRMGTFVVLPEVELGVSASSNVFNSPSARSDHAYVIRPTIRAVSNWRRHAVELRGTSNLSFYDDFDSEDDRSYQLEARGRLDVTRRMNFEALVSHSVTQESRGGADSTAGSLDRADETTNIAALTFNRRFNRLSVQLRGMVTDFDAAEAEAVTGGVIDNDDQDYRELLGAVRLAWEFKPTLTVFGEVSVGEREHDEVAQSDGISRSSDLRRYRAGVTVGDDRSIWSGELAIGYGINDLRDDRLSDVDGILLDGSLTWRPTALTSLLLTLQSDLAETRIAGSGGSRDYQAAIELRHAFRPNIVATTGASYNLRDFDSSELEETTWLLNGGIEYSMNRNVSLFGRYQHEIFETNSGDGDYRDNTFNFGLRLRR